MVSTVATPGEWQCKIRTVGVRRLAVANGPNIFQMLLVFFHVVLLVIVFELLTIRLYNVFVGKKTCLQLCLNVYELSMT